MRLFGPTTCTCYIQLVWKSKQDPIFARLPFSKLNKVNDQACEAFFSSNSLALNLLSVEGAPVGLLV